MYGSASPSGYKPNIVVGYKSEDLHQQKDVRNSKYKKAQADACARRKGLGPGINLYFRKLRNVSIKYKKRRALPWERPPLFILYTLLSIFLVPLEMLFQQVVHLLGSEGLDKILSVILL
jgi:hypothetical protein